MGPGSGLALDGGGARAVVLTLGSVLNVKQLLLKSLLLFLLNVKTQKQCFSVNVEQLYVWHCAHLLAAVLLCAAV